MVVIKSSRSIETNSGTFSPLQQSTFVGKHSIAVSSISDQNCLIGVFLIYICIIMHEQNLVRKGFLPQNLLHQSMDELHSNELQSSKFHGRLMVSVFSEMN